MNQIIVKKSIKPDQVKIREKNKNYKELKMKLKENGEVICGCFDRIFKAIFNDKINKNILAYLIKSVLKNNIEFSLDEIKENMIVEDPVHPNATFEEIGSASDLVITIKNKRILIELNRELNKSLFERNHRHYCKSLIEGSRTNDKYDITDIYQINLDVKNLYGSKLINEFDIWNDYINDKKLIYHVNLEKVWDVWYNDIRNLNRLEKILIMLELNNIEELEEIAKGDEELMELSAKIQSISKTNDTLSKIYSDNEQEWFRKTEMRNVRNEGLNEGIIIGRDEGINEIAKIMLAKNYNINEISEVTGLSIKKLEKLK